MSIVELAIDAAGHVGDVARHQRPTVAQAARQRWTQAALGALLGVAQPTVASWLPVNGGDNARIISADNPSKSAPDGETLDGDGGEQELEPTPLEEAVAQAESRTSGSAASLDTEAISMTETTSTTPKLQRYTVTADVLLTFETEAGSPAEALAAYQAFRLAHLELHGRNGVTVLLPADLPAVVTTGSGKLALRVERVGGSEGRKPSRFNPAGQLRHGNGRQDHGEAGTLDRRS